MNDSNPAPSRAAARSRASMAALLMLAVSIFAGATVVAPHTASAVGAPQWTDSSDAEAVTAAWSAMLAPSPAIGFSGDVASCDPGTTSSAFRAAELRSVNAMRRLVGVKPVTENTAWSAQAQQAALMMDAARQLSHAPAPEWPCYTGTGADAAGSSNLFLYENGVEAMWGYVADWGAGNAVVGHRRWLLCPTTAELGFGDTLVANATKVFGDSPGAPEESRDGFVAWPNPGLVPLNLAEPRGLLERFSVQLPMDHSVAGATVEITSSAGGTVPLDVVTRSDEAYCSPAVVFEPSRAPVAGETWTVRISGITANGSPVTAIEYATTFSVLSSAVPFVKAAYTDFLGRLPTATELDRETGFIDDGLPRTDLIMMLSRSQEWISHIVHDFYTDTLGRAPDASGLAYWTSTIASGRASVAKVASQFYASSEYFQVTAHGNTTAWVEDLYVKLLGREADAGGRDYWVATTRRSGRGAVAFSMYQSQESRQARTTALYEALLGRLPDRAGLLYWAGKLRTQGDLALAVNLAGSSEYASRARDRF